MAETVIGRHPGSNCLRARVFTVPAESTEADATLTWDTTTVVTVQADRDDVEGLGWTYSSPAAATLIEHHIAPSLADHDLLDVAGCFAAMLHACRNLGATGLVMQAISAVDIALWDLRSRLWDVPLQVVLGGAAGAAVPVYGSGGFVNLSSVALDNQIARWLQLGCRAVKIKIGGPAEVHQAHDLSRLEQVRYSAGPDVAIMVDANGWYSRGEAVRVGAELDRFGVTWFEEPVSSDDPRGLAAVRDRVQADVSAGEYICTLDGALALCRSVDCLQLDVTRCGGYTGWLRCAAVALAHHLPVSAHCAPALHAQLAGVVPHLRHVEWFADHVRVDGQLFSGTTAPVDGLLSPRPAAGHGMRVGAGAGRFETADRGLW